MSTSTHSFGDAGARCPACAADVPAGARFCGQCGIRLSPVCLQCGAPGVAGQRCCVKCGAVIDAKPMPADPALVVQTGEADRRLMTVLFCDLVGSRDIAARYDPEDFATLLVAYRECSASSILRHGGYVSRYLGDGILACFGYPRALGRDAQSAIACGLDISRQVSELSMREGLLGANELAVRVGVETGVVVAGNLGPSWALELDSLVGVAPNTAAQLQHLATPGTVVIGEATYSVIANDFECEELPPERTRSLHPAQRAFVVKGESRDRATRGAGGTDAAPLVGRTGEMAELGRHWTNACGGRGQTVVIAGEPGIGKSRLTREFMALLADKPHAAFILECSAQAASTALHPVLELLRASLPSGDAAARSGDVTPTLSEFLRPLGLDIGDAERVLAGALGFATGDADGQDNAVPRRQALMRILRAWLLHGSSDRPAVIVVEDLHWCDPSLAELLRDVAEASREAKVLLLATFRGDYAPDWLEPHATSTILLKRLERAQAERVLEWVAPGHGTATRQAILARAEGVPLFLEEFARATDSPAVPHSLQQMFTARLDGLGASKGLAQLASVLGREVELDLLRPMADLPDDVLRGRLESLVAAEVLSPIGAERPRSYLFRHALLQQAAYDSLLRARRQALHARAAAALLEYRPQLRDRQPDLIAQHYLAAGEHELAVAWLIRAARLSLAAAAYAEAEAILRKGLEAATALSGAAKAETELELKQMLGLALIARQGYASQAVHDTYEDALRIAEDAPDKARILAPLRGLASFYQVRGPVPRAKAISDQLVAAAEHSADPIQLVDAWRRRGWSAYFTGRLEEAEADLTRAIASFVAARRAEHIEVAGDDPQVLALANLAWIEMSRFGADAALGRAAEAAAAARMSPHAVSACYGRTLAAVVYQGARHWGIGLELARETLAIAEQKGVPYWAALARIVIGYDLAMRSGAAADGKAMVLEGMESYARSQAHLLRPFILLRLAEVHGLLGELDAAGAALDEAWALSETLGARKFLPEIGIVMAQVFATSWGGTRLADLLSSTHAEALDQKADALARRAAALMTEMGLR
jgi:class 3 adenylate cyclase